MPKQKKRLTPDPRTEAQQARDEAQQARRMARDTGSGRATALIAAAKARQFTAAPPEAALAELREVLAYNDGVPVRARVSAADAVGMLAAHGWACTSRRALDMLCQRVLGRKSYGTK